MNNNIVMPKNSALDDELKAVLEIYNDVPPPGWLSSEEYTPKLMKMIGEDQYRSSYNKKAQIPAYYGFIEWQDYAKSTSPRRITEAGRKFYLAWKNNNTDRMYEAIFNSLETCSFGRDNLGSPSSSSDVQPPNLCVRAILDLGFLKVKEFAYLLWRIADRFAGYTETVQEIKNYREGIINIDFSELPNTYTDAKPITFLKNIGFLVDSLDGLVVNLDIDKRYRKRLKNLKIYSVDRNPSDYTSQESAKVKGVENCSIQLITYGAPGTGKSHGVEEVVGSYENTVRTTFHPDSDYSTFVGCYKPTMEAKPKYGPQGLPIKVNGVELTEDIISYSYVPQAFTKAYVRAWKSLTPDSEGKVSPQFLVIEEINRGNCAQIFGDLFQLLDRDDGGYSKYAIEADSDLARHISKELANAEGDIPENIRKGTILKLPPNLYIWATMNTSDQSLFPMDSAFKRRWEWRYVPIRDAGKNWKIASDKYDWWEFIKKINGLISSATNSEDKQLGYFFARPDDASSNVISASRFVNKVLFYLYNDVFKDYDLPQAFSKQEGGRFAFGDFFLDNGEADEDAVNELLSGILGEKAE